MATERRWDVGEEVVIKKSSAAPMRGKSVLSSTVHVVFGVVTVISSMGQTQAAMPFTSNPKTVVERVQVVRADALRDKSTTRATVGEVDGRIGLSTGKLADLFPRLYVPATEEEADGEPFYLS